MDFGFCFCVVQILSVAIFRAANSGCSEPHSASEMRTFSLSPLPDRNGSVNIVGSDPCVVPFRGKDTSYRECRFIPPHQSLTRQLPPKGKPLQNPLHFITTGGRVEVRELVCFVLLLVSCFFVCFSKLYSPCSHARIKGFPLGRKKTVSSLSRKRLMRADRKGNPQCKVIFAMFAQRTEGFPSGGSCRVSD